MDTFERARLSAHYKNGRPLRSLEEVLGLLERSGLLLLASGKLSLPGLADAVAGECVRGSWWSHPEGHRIYALSNQLCDRTDLAISGKIVSGRVTFVHRRLWPSLDQCAREEARRHAEGLSPDERGLLERLRSGESVRASACGLEKARWKSLEERWLLASTQEHTETGNHETILTSWDAALGAAAPPFAPPSPSSRSRVRVKENGGESAIARTALLTAAMRASLAAPEREILGWFPWPAEETRTLLDQWLSDGTCCSEPAGRSRRVIWRRE